MDNAVSCCSSNEGRRRRRLALPCNAIAMDASKEEVMHYSRALMLLHHTVQWLVMIDRFIFSSVANHIWQWQQPI